MHAIKKIDRLKFSKVFLVLLSASSLVAFVCTSLLRLSYPLELLPVEGNMLEHVKRIIEHKPLFTSPSLDFVSAVYTPVYYYACAFFSGLDSFGEFAPLRMVSLVSSALTGGLIFFFVKKITKDSLASFVSMALYFMLFEKLDGFFDTARVDSLHNFFELLAVFVLYFASRRLEFFVSGLLFVLAIFTKQSSLVLFALLMGGCFCFKRSGVVPMIAGAAIASLIFWFAFPASELKWLYFYTVQSPATHGWLVRNLVGFWLHDVLAVFPIVLLFVFTSYGLGARLKGLQGVTLFALVFVSYIGRCKVGGGWNADLRAYSAIAVLFGVTFSYLMRKADDSKTFNSNQLKALAYFAAILQITALVYNPANLIPNHDDFVFARSLKDEISKFPANVLILNQGYLTRGFNSKRYFDPMAGAFIVPGQSGQLFADLNTEIEKKTFSAVMLDKLPQGDFLNILERSYKFSSFLTPRYSHFYQKTEASYPLYVYLPKK